MTQAQHTWQRGTSEKSDIVVGTATKPNAFATPNAAPASADIDEAAEKATLVKTENAHNSPQVAGEHDSPPAATETAGATLNEANPLAAYPDNVATACSPTDLNFPTPPTHAVKYAAVKNTAGEKTYISGEAKHEPSTTEAPPKSTQAPNNSNMDLTQNIMHRHVMETQ